MLIPVGSFVTDVGGDNTATADIKLNPAVYLLLIPKKDKIEMNRQLVNQWIVNNNFCSASTFLPVPLFAAEHLHSGSHAIRPASSGGGLWLSETPPHPASLSLKPPLKGNIVFCLTVHACVIHSCREGDLHSRQPRSRLRHGHSGKRTG